MKFLYIFLFFSTLIIYMDTACMLRQVARLNCHRNILQTKPRIIGGQRVRWYNGGHPEHPEHLQEQIDTLTKRIETLEENEYAVFTLYKKFVGQGDIWSSSNNEPHDSYIPEHKMHYENPRKLEE